MTRARPGCRRRVGPAQHAGVAVVVAYLAGDRVVAQLQVQASVAAVAYGVGDQLVRGQDEILEVLTGPSLRLRSAVGPGDALSDYGSVTAAMIAVVVDRALLSSPGGRQRPLVGFPCGPLVRRTGIGVEHPRVSEVRFSRDGEVKLRDNGARE